MKVIALIFLLACSTAGQTDPILQHEFFGPIRATGFKTTKLGIKYNAQGLDNAFRERKITKGANWLRNRGATDALIKEFEEYARVVPEYIPGWLDAAFLDAREKGLACGGRYAEMARKIRPSDVTVIIKAGGFPYRGQIISGIVERSGLIHISVLTVNKLKTDPPHAYFQTIPALAVWEISNYFWHNRMGIPVVGGPDNEIGGRSPCGIKLVPRVVEQ